MRIVAVAALLCMVLCGCANIPLRDGELVIDSNTTAGLEDAGVASINRQF